MNSEIIKSMGKDLSSDPVKIAELIRDVAKNIGQCKNNLNEIKDRGFFKRLFSNSTKDLTSAVIVQNDAMSTFMNIVQAILFLNMSNTKTLGDVSKHLLKTDQTLGSAVDDYTKLAVDFIDTFVLANEHSQNELDKIRNQILEKQKIDEEQDEKIGFLIDSHTDLKMELKSKQMIDENQELMLAKISEHQSKLMTFVKEQKDLLDTTSTLLKTKIDEYDKKTGFNLLGFLGNVVLIVVISYVFKYVLK